MKIGCTGRLPDKARYKPWLSSKRRSRRNQKRLICGDKIVNFENLRKLLRPSVIQQNCMYQYTNEWAHIMLLFLSCLNSFLQKKFFVLQIYSARGSWSGFSPMPIETAKQNWSASVPLQLLRNILAPYWTSKVLSFPLFYWSGKRMLQTVKLRFQKLVLELPYSNC